MTVPAGYLKLNRCEKGLRWLADAKARALLEESAVKSDLDAKPMSSAEVCLHHKTTLPVTPAAADS